MLAAPGRGLFARLDQADPGGSMVVGLREGGVEDGGGEEGR